MWLPDGYLSNNYILYGVEQLVVAATVSAAVLCCFVVRSRAPLWLRGLVLAGLMLLPAVFSAPEWWCYFAGQIVTLMAIGSVVDRRRGVPRPRWEQVPLLLVCLGMIVAAATLPGVYQVDWLLIGIALGAAFGLIDAGVTARRRWFWKSLAGTAAAVVLAGAAGGFINNYDLAGWKMWHDLYGVAKLYQDKPWNNHYFVLGLNTHSIGVFTVGAVCWRARVGLARAHSRWLRYLRFFTVWPILALCAFLCITPLFEVLWYLPPRAMAPETIAESPEYRTLIRMAKRLDIEPHEHKWRALDEEDFYRVVDANRASLSRIEQLLERQQHFPIDYRPFASHMPLPDAAALNNIFVLLIAQFVCADHDQATEEQVRAIRSLLLLAKPRCRSPLVFEVRDGRRQESFAYFFSFLIRDRLSAQEYETLRKLISESQAGVHTPQDIDHATRHRWLVVFGWRQRVAHVFDSGSGFKRYEIFDQSEHRDWKGLVICELALAQYYLANGCYPAQLADLVPRYLESVPREAETGLPFCYHHDPSGKTPTFVYSRSFNRVDDGGRYDWPGWGGKPDDVSLAMTAWHGDERFELDPLPQLRLSGEDPPDKELPLEDLDP